MSGFNSYAPSATRSRKAQTRERRRSAAEEVEGRGRLGGPLIAAVAATVCLRVAIRKELAKASTLLISSFETINCAPLETTVLSCYRLLNAVTLLCLCLVAVQWAERTGGDWSHGD